MASGIGSRSPGESSVWSSPSSCSSALDSTDGEVEDQASWLSFAVLCIVHAAAAVYVVSALTAVASWLTFTLRAIALALALTMYGWSLVAPKALANYRNFKN